MSGLLMFLVGLGLVLGQLGRPGVFSFSPAPITFLDGAVFVLVAAALVRWFQKGRIFTVSSLAWPQIVFLAWLLVGALLPLLPHTSGDIVVGLQYWVRLSLLWLVPWSMTELHIQVRSWWYWWLGTGLALTVLGLLQLAIYPDFKDIAVFGWDPHQGRLTSTFLDPNYFGGYLAMLIAVAAVFLKEVKDASYWWRVVAWMILVLAPIAELLTFSRSGYLAFVIVIGVLGVRYVSRLWLAVGLLVMSASLLVPRVRERVVGGATLDVTAQMRVVSWAQALRVSQGVELTGVGFNYYAPALEELGEQRVGVKMTSSDSVFLGMFATSGLVGVVLFLISLASWIVLVFRSHTPLRTVFLAIIPALIIHGFFVNTLFSVFMMVPLLVLIGMWLREVRSNP